MGNEKTMSFLKLFISYVFVKKSNFVFFLFFNAIYFDSLKGFRLCIVDTRRRNILYFIENLSIYKNYNSGRLACLIEAVRRFVSWLPFTVVSFQRFSLSGIIFRLRKEARLNLSLILIFKR